MKNATKYITKNLIISIVVFVVIAAILSAYSITDEKPEEIQVSQLISQINEGAVKTVIVKGDVLEIELNDGNEQITKKEGGESFSALLSNYEVDADKMSEIEVDIQGESGFGYWLGVLLPFLLPFALIAFFIWIMLRQVQGANNRAMTFGSSSAREIPKNAKDKVTFKDVAGAREAKEELMEVVEFLKSPKKFINLGAKIPKGVLLMGSPGTGKTLLARAVAGEANVPFFHISGSEFVEMFVGVGASRVRDLFNKAKKNAPCIVFVDEIDAVGRQRGAGLGGSHDEREQTLNQILVEMDGFDPNAGVIVLAATNRPDVLDPALLRPGRFDRRVVIDLPDINGREAILKIHATGKPLSEDVNLRRVAERTPGFSGADLANLMNEGAILAARRNKKMIGVDELMESIEKVLLGPERKSHILSEGEREVTAYHEAGHAIIANELPDADPVHKISIISRGRAAGFTLKLPTEDRSMRRRAEMMADLATALGGYAVEVEFFGWDKLSTGPSQDLKNVTDVARRMVMDYGMSEKLAPRSYGQGEEMVFLGKEMHRQKDFSENTAQIIDAEISKIVEEAKATAVEIIKKRRKDLEKVVEILLEKETIEREEFEKMTGGKKTHDNK